MATETGKNVSAQQVKDLRDRTGAGFTACRDALAEANGDIEQAKATGKPAPVIEKIVNGKMEKFYEENCLYEQHFIKDEGTTVKELVDQAIAKLGEHIAIRRFARFKVGEMDGAAAASEGTETASQ